LVAWHVFPIIQVQAQVQSSTAQQIMYESLNFQHELQDKGTLFSLGSPVRAAGLVDYTLF